MRLTLNPLSCAAWLALTVATCGLPGAVQPSRAATTPPASCPDNHSGITLPPGFCATVYADGIGHARHLVVAPDGTVYVNTWSGGYYGNDTPHAGGFLVALTDTTGAGKADVAQRFGETVNSGGTGGTGIGLYQGYLYAEANHKVVRYRLTPGSAVPKDPPQTVVAGLPLTGDHPMHPFIIDGEGQMYVDVATETNSCQPLNRMLESPGSSPCTELLTRGGVWRYDAQRLDQAFSPAQRYATGIRNAEGFAIDPVSHHLFVTQHGRDQLHSNWPSLYAMEQEATLPAEELLLLEPGHDYGWPECYYDPGKGSLVQAPEYGGDGRRIGTCRSKTGPVAAFPAHWAPNGMVYYDRPQFPSAYRNGVFIAFHGSWNRAPYAQHGYNVVFQALSGDRAGRCEIFADGFAGVIASPDKAAHRPSGIAVGPDGALYVSDDVGGRIYRITYRGDAAAAHVPSRFVPCPSATAPAGPIAAAAVGGAPAADGTRVLDAHALPVPEGATREMVLTGERIYHGQVGGAACTGCHGQNGTGSPLGPNLTANRWSWSDGTFAGIAATIRVGVAQPRNYRAPMPPMGGAQLSADQVSAVAAYVWAISQPPVESSLAATITIPGERVYPESITATADGRLIIGSITRREIFEVRPGASLATPWIGADAETTLGVLGVYADDASGTLWACYSDFPGSTGSPQAPSTLVAFDLESGAPRRRYVLPTPQAFCNDIAVTADGTVYVTDTNNMEVDRLRPGEAALQRWIGDGAFGAKGGILDGISVVGPAIVVSTLATGRVYSIPVTATGAPGPVSELRLSRPLQQPDGMRVLGTASTVIAESGGAGRLSRLDISGSDAVVTTLREGFPDGPVSVAIVGSKAYVLEGQLADLYGPPGATHAVRAFRATRVDLPAVRPP